MWRSTLLLCQSLVSPDPPIHSARELFSTHQRTARGSAQLMCLTTEHCVRRQHHEFPDMCVDPCKGSLRRRIRIRLRVENAYRRNVTVGAVYNPVSLKTRRSLQNGQKAGHYRRAHFGLTTFQAVFADIYITDDSPFGLRCVRITPSRPYGASLSRSQQVAACLRAQPKRRISNVF